MIRVSIIDERQLYPFNDRARDLRIQNKPLWLHQRDLLADYTQSELEITSFNDIFDPIRFPIRDEACLIFKDNIFFDEFFLTAFMEAAQQRDKPCRVAFNPTDKAFTEHALPLSNSYIPASGLYLGNLWYYPNGPTEEEPEPLIIDMLTNEVGYYHVPTYMATQQGDLTFQVPLRSFIAIDSWVHIFIADMVFGLFGRGIHFEKRLDEELSFKLETLATALYEGKQLLECSKVVQIGKNCVIDPSAIIHGPTTIGNNVTIGAGTVIENCIIGNNVNISQGCQLMLSVIGDGTFLPFRAALFMTTIMENGMVAQNTCLQMCVVGRNTFIGAGTTFTDYNLLPAPILALDGRRNLSESNRPVLGGCVGHNCRLGAGLVISPARVIESDVVLVARDDRQIISKNIAFKDSDHHTLRASQLHKPLYRPDREEQREIETW